MILKKKAKRGADKVLACDTYLLSSNFAYCENQGNAKISFRDSAGDITHTLTMDRIDAQTLCNSLSLRLKKKWS